MNCCSVATIEEKEHYFLEVLRLNVVVKHIFKYRKGQKLRCDCLKDNSFLFLCLQSGREDTEGAMAFFLKPRPCTWHLALDYHSAKQFEGNQRWLERTKVPVPCVFWAEMFSGVGDSPAPPSVSVGPPSPTSICLLFHLQPQLDIYPPSPTSTSSHISFPLPFSLKSHQ